MRKTTPWLALAACAALLVGCSSNSGSTASTTTTSSTSTAGSTSSAMTSSAMSGSSGADITEPSTTAMSSSEMSSAGTGSGSSSDESGSVSSSGAATFDKATTTWFSTFCTGFLKASVDTATVNTLLKGKLTAASKAPLLAGYQKSAADFKAAGEALSGLAVPTVTNGKELATEIPKTLSTVAATITALEKQTEAIDATKNPSQLLAVAEAKSADLQTQAQAAVAPITKMDAATQNNLLSIPACAQLQKAVAGG